MATIKCPRCGQDFRGEGGLKWHLNRIHEHNQESREIDSLSDKPLQHELRHDEAQLEVLQENRKFHQQQTEGINNCVGQPSILLTHLKDRVDELDRRTTSLDSRNKQVEDQETRYAALKD